MSMCSLGRLRTGHAAFGRPLGLVRSMRRWLEICRQVVQQSTMHCSRRGRPLQHAGAW